MSAVYFCVCVRVCVRVGSVLLNFQRIQTVHTLLQHITLWHPLLGIVHAVLTQLSPSLLHFPLLCYWELSSVAQCALFCRRLHFIGTALLRGCFSKGHKLVIIQSWKSLLDQWILLPQSLSFILDSSFSSTEQKGQTFSWSLKQNHWITLEWLAGLKSVFLGSFRMSCSIREPPFGTTVWMCVCVHVCLEILFIFLCVSACISCLINVCTWVIFKVYALYVFLLSL